MLSNPGGCCRLSMRALRLPFRISCDSWDRQRVCKVTEGRSDSWKISSLFRSRERSSMTYCGFSEVPLKGHLKWTSYQISNLFKAHDSHLLFASSFAGEQKPSKELFRSFGKPLLCSRTEMKRPWRGKMAKKVSKLWWSFKVIRVRLVFFCMNASSSRKKMFLGIVHKSSLSLACIMTDWGRNLFREKDWHNMFAELRAFLAN